MTGNLKSSMSRRALLGGLATMPVFLPRAMADEATTPRSQFMRPAPPITSADQVINVKDFEPLARDALPPAHFGYIATGADDDRTVIRNHAAFSDYQIRARRFNDLSRLTTATSVFGASWASPLYLSAVSAMRAFHPEGEIAVARAPRTRALQLMLSTGSSSAPAAVGAASGAPLWQQLYATNDFAVTTAIVRRAEKAGSTAIVLTADSPGKRNNETLRRAMQVDNRQCDACHIGNSHEMWKNRPVFAGLDVSHVTGLAPPALTTEFLDKLRAIVKGKLFIKGIVTGEDAAIALDHGADGIIVSNHGGRNEETLRA